jgi:hypothetical protein
MMFISLNPLPLPQTSAHSKYSKGMVPINQKVNEIMCKTKRNYHIYYGHLTSNNRYP